MLYFVFHLGLMEGGSPMTDELSGLMVFKEKGRYSGSLCRTFIYFGNLKSNDFHG